GTGVRLFQIFANGDFGGRIDQIEFAHFIVGAETNPDAIPLLPGTVLYTGGVRGLLFNEAGSAGASGALSGTVQLSVAFGAGTVSGDVFLNTDGPNVTLELAPTDITGNGFAGDLTIVSCTIGTCTSNSEIGGVFMGEFAESIGGILDLDIGVTDSEGNTSDLVGNGGFIAFDQES
ncbi:MAG: transferrin-binding protein-like solute binding protein, partial [Pseudomonadota bacterium]